MTKYQNMVFDFNHCYPKVNDSTLVWHDCSSVMGSRLYCSAEAEGALKQMIEPYGVFGIHFIDSGDYHYISKFMTDYIKEAFVLFLIDHHTDMQKPLIEGMTSCGSWAREVLEQNNHLKQLILMGQDQEMLTSLDVPNKEKLIGISYDRIKSGKAMEQLGGIETDIPAYISIDKDVLQEQYAVTNWDQGDMPIDMLEQLLKYLIMDFKVVGIDICGEYPDEYNFSDFLHAQRVNEQTNTELYSYVSNLLKIKRGKELEPKTGGKIQQYVQTCG